MNENYYKDGNYYYSEYAIALEKFHYKDSAKLAIPALFPNLPTDEKQKQSKKLSSVKIENSTDKSKLNIDTVTIQNYITLKIPEYITSCYANTKTGIVPKGTKFILIFVGGDLSCPQVIGGVD